jgi:hypothetical protein
MVVKGVEVICKYCSRIFVYDWNSHFQYIILITWVHFNFLTQKLFILQTVTEWASRTVCRPLTLTWTQNIIKNSHNISLCLLTERPHQLLFMTHSITFEQSWAHRMSRYIKNNQISERELSTLIQIYRALTNVYNFTEEISFLWTIQQLTFKVVLCFRSWVTFCLKVKKKKYQSAVS